MKRSCNPPILMLGRAFVCVASLRANDPVALSGFFNARLGVLCALRISICAPMNLPTLAVGLAFVVRPLLARRVADR
ncbi:hypothetical protein DENSPDRAFT_835862 [Dentipellis sp. KUC8613]|nr:hypothetical protein DENSPDRAFT_835862 [Dentipellis sp. KUC8613]